MADGKCVLAFLLLVFAASMPHAANLNSMDALVGATLSVSSATDVEMLSFSASPPSVVSGQQVEFSVTVQSVGNNIADYVASVYIRSQDGTLVEILNYTNTTIVGGETHVLVKQWSTAGMAAGTYIAYANATFTGNQATATKNASFAITAQQNNGETSGSGSGGSSGVESYKPKENVEIPLSTAPPAPAAGSTPGEQPKLSGLSVSRLGSYVESAGGGRLTLTPLIENPSDSPITIDIGFSGPEAALSQKSEGVVLSAHEKKTVPLGLLLPKDMPAGYYTFNVKITSDGKSVSYPMVVHIVPVAQDGGPVVTRSVSLDYDTKTTLVTLTVSNRGDAPINYLEVNEKLPSTLSAMVDGMEFIDEPGKSGRGADGSLSVSWRFDGLGASETRSVYYRLAGLVSDAADAFSGSTVDTVEGKKISTEGTMIRELTVPTLMPGRQSEIKVSLFNPMSSAEGIELSLFGPEQWKISPTSSSMMLDSRQGETLKFLVTPPAGAASGTYGLTLHMARGDSVSYKGIYAYISKPVIEIYAPPLSEQFLAWIAANWLFMLVLFAACALGAFIAHVGYGKFRENRYDETRADYLRMMKEAVGENKKE